MSVVLETPRLRLRELALEDLDFVAEMLGDRDVMRFYPKPLDREESRQWIERQLLRYSDHGHGLWMAEDRSTGAPVGQVGLVLQQVEGDWEPEIGYLIHRPFWRRGFASEAALAVRDDAFGARGERRVISLIRPENLPSQGVARKIGMAPEREVHFLGSRHVVFAARSVEPENA
ncbi:MAG TPA: GNAT family N-acetyltransferase [Thermoanaerobaculia bacterium]|nr:GNAT family N-acetyltransferase [Thermoanaerobaculia bacterium]